MRPKDTTAPVSQNTLKKRRQRANVKKDAARYDVAKVKDRIRKQKSRAEKSQKLKRSKTLQDEERKRYREAKRKYRAAKKNKLSTLHTENVEGAARKAAGKRQYRKKKNAAKQKEKTIEKKIDQAKKKIEQANKKKEVMRVQKWRMKIKLAKNSNKPKLQPVRTSIPKTSNQSTVTAGDVVDVLNATIHELKPKGGMTSLHKQSYCALQQAALVIKAKYAGLKVKKPDVNWKAKPKTGPWWLQPSCRKVRKDKTSPEVIEEIEDFYTDGMISRTMPDIRGVKTQENGEYCPRYTMTCTLQEAFESYKHKYPNRKVGFTTFKKAKPSNVKKVSETSRRSCLCQICCNASLKAEAFRGFVSGSNDLKQHIKLIKLSKKDTVKLTVCDYDTEHPRADCLARTCKDCGPKQLGTYYQPILQNHENDIITWYKWGNIMMNSGDKTKRITSCIRQQTSLQEFIIAYEKDLDTLASHLFRADWQHQQMGLCIKTLHKNEAALIMDYAENYSCSFKDESQNAFFEKNTVTIHPMMLYYRSQVDEDNDMLIKHALIGITDDDLKDAAGVRAFENEAVAIAKAEVKLQHLHEWTDGCSAQYKGKNSFYDISGWDQRLTRNYFETSHGKSVCDGLGSIVKNGALRAVFSGKAVIANATDLFNFSKTKLERERSVVKRDGKTYISIRQFVFIKQSDVDHTARNCQTLPGTRKFHAVQNIGTLLRLKTRELSCYCPSCKTGQDKCLSDEYVLPWSEASQKHLSVPSPKASGGGVNAAQSSVDRAALIRQVSQTGKPKTNKPSGKQKRVNQQQDPQSDCSTPKRFRCRPKKSPNPIDGATTTEYSPCTLSQDINEGDFAAVKLQGKRKETCSLYMAEVDSIEGEQVYLRYMVKEGNLYKWPSVDDYSLEDLTSIICTMAHPTLVNSRGQFRFKQEAIDGARSKAMKKLNIKTVLLK